MTIFDFFKIRFLGLYKAERKSEDIFVRSGLSIDIHFVDIELSYDILSPLPIVLSKHFNHPHPYIDIAIAISDITPRPSLQSYIMHAVRGGVIYIGNTQSVSISFLFLFFFHQSSLYPIKIFAKCFYLLVCILFSAPTLSKVKLIIFFFFLFP